MRLGVLLVLALLLASAAALAQAEREPPQRVRVWLETRPGGVDVFLLPSDSGPATWLGSSLEPLTLSLEQGQTDVVLCLQASGYRPTVLRLHRSQVTEGARLGLVVLEPVRGEGLQRLGQENLWLMVAFLAVLALYLHSRLTVRRASRALVPQPPPSIGEVVYAADPFQPSDLLLRRNVDGFALSCGGVVGVVVGLVVWGVSHLAGTLPLSPDWIAKGFALGCLATALMEILLAEPVTLASYVGEHGLARFQFHFGVQCELLLFQEVARVEEDVQEQEKDMGYHRVVYRWLSPSGLEHLVLEDVQGASGFASAALAAWRERVSIEK